MTPIIIIIGYLCCNAALTPDKFEQALSDGGKNVTLEGKVYCTKKREMGYTLYLKKVKTEYNNYIYSSKNVAVYCDEVYGRGTDVIVKGVAELFNAPSNPGEFDSTIYYKSIGIYYKVKADNTTIKCSNKNVIYTLSDKVKNAFESTIARLTDTTTASVFYAMLLGDREELSDELMSKFSDCGIGHILAISGLHISILGMGLYKILRKSGMGFVGAMIVACAFIVFYGVMTGNSVSTVRASIMFCMAVLANTIGRTYDILSALSLSAIISLLRQPLMLYNSGFLLSYLAVLGVAVVLKAISAIVKTDNKIINTIIASVSIQLTTIPVIMYYYYKIPVYSLFLNIIVIPLMSVVMISALSGGILGMWVYSLGKISIGPAVYLIKFFTFLCDNYKKLPKAEIITGRPEIWQIIAYYVVLSIFLILCCRWKKKWNVAILPLLITVMLRYDRTFTLTFVSVGQGDCAFIRTCEGETFLIDCGSSDNKQLYNYTVKPFLLSKGVGEIDNVIVSHCDSDHINGITEIISNDDIEIKNLYIPQKRIKEKKYEKLYTMAVSKDVNVMEIKKGYTLNGKDMTLSCLYPGDEMVTDLNEFSTVMLLKYKEYSALFTGDISEAQEQLLCSNEQLINGVSILKSAHHGSETANSDTFLAKIHPIETVISCGIDNSYGHPHKRTIDNLHNVHTRIRRTDKEGAIIYKLW